MTPSLRCPLCHESGDVHALGPRHFNCGPCDLRFLRPEHRLDPATEKSRYDMHRNSADDADYLNFLRPLVEAISVRVPKRARGLDFGSGPAPVMANWFEKLGYQMDIYDPYYAPDRARLSDTYDFITVSEAAEHFFNPGEEFAFLRERLSPDGVLGVMTSLTDGMDFLNWHYPRDPTHVVFYSQKCMKWIADHFAFHEPVFLSSRLTIF